MCLSNTISQSNPYFEYFKFPVLDPGTTTVINDGKVIIDYPLSQELQDDRKNNSLIGDIAKGTEYASYSFDSKMVGDSEAFILEGRPNTKRLHGIIKIAGKVFFVWECKDDIYWVTDKGKIPNGFKYKFAVRNDDMEMGYRPYNYRMDGLHAATFAFVDNKLFFANQMCKQRWYEFIL